MRTAYTTQLSRLLRITVTLSVCISVFTCSSCSPIPDYSNPALDLSSKNIDALLDEYTDTHKDTGCRATLITSPDQAHQTFVDMINSAQHHINIETLNFDDDSELAEDISQEFITLLSRKANEGVEINLIIDPVGQRIYGEISTLNRLRSAGINVEAYTPPVEKLLLDQLLYRTHKKLMVVDGTKAIIGGRNFGFYYFSDTGWRDTNVLIEGPAVNTIQKEFALDWENLGGKTLRGPQYFPKLQATGDQTLRPADNRPACRDYDINVAVVIALRLAQNSILIETPNLNPPDWLADELTDASQRGVNVSILTNSKQSFDMETLFASYAGGFDTLLENGVRIFLWPGESKIHSKAIAVDNRFAMAGSYNFNCRSTGWDAENGIIFTQAGDVTQIADMILSDIDTDNVEEIDMEWIASQNREELDYWDFAGMFDWLF